jgi:hypothetical protein
LNQLRLIIPKTQDFHTLFPASLRETKPSLIFWYGFFRYNHKKMIFNPKLYNMTTTSKLVLGIIGAAAAGVAIGLLTAPCKGSETRQKISKTTGSWVNSVGQLLSRGKHELDGVKQKIGRTRTAAHRNLAV